MYKKCVQAAFCFHTAADQYVLLLLIHQQVGSVVPGFRLMKKYLNWSHLRKYNRVGTIKIGSRHCILTFLDIFLFCKYFSII